MHAYQRCESFWQQILHFMSLYWPGVHMIFTPCRTLRSNFAWVKISTPIQPDWLLEAFRDCYGKYSAGKTDMCRVLFVCLQNTCVSTWGFDFSCLKNVHAVGFDIRMLQTFRWKVWHYGWVCNATYWHRFSETLLQTAMCGTRTQE